MSNLIKKIGGILLSLLNWVYRSNKIKKHKRFNVLLNHLMEDGSTLLSEIQVCGLNELEALKSAQYQIDYFNKKNGSNFLIDKLWELKYKEIILKNEKLIPELSDKEKAWLFSGNNFNYLKEEKQSLYSLH